MQTKLNKSLFVIGSITLFCVAFSVVAQQGKKKDEKAKNLKVIIPKDISHDDLDKQMDFFANSLHVKCSFCHADSKTRPGKLDFAADSNARHKEDSRRMIQLTYDINRKYFGVQNPEVMVNQVVNCYTCHRGEEYPIYGFDTIAARKHL
jgi:hypothetical protein